MRRGRIFIYLGLVMIILLALAFVVVTRLLPSAGGGMAGGGSQAQATPTPTKIVETIDVVMVAQHIGRGDLIDETKLTSAPIQLNLYYEGYITDKADVVGKRARIDLEAGMFLTRSYIAESYDDLAKIGSNAALLIPPNMVAVSIPINRLSAVSYAPQRGDHVSVIVTLLLVDLDPNFQTSLPNQTAAVIAPGPNALLGLGRDDKAVANLTVNELLRIINAQVVGGGQASPQGRAETDPLLEQTLYVIPAEAQRPRLVSQTLIQNVIVLQVGNFPLTDDVQEKPTPEAAPVADSTATPPTPTPQPTQQGAAAAVEQKMPDVITLIVTPQDAVTLNYLIYAGAEITLALRPYGDESRIQTEAVTLSFLLEQYNIQLPARLPYGLEPRINELVQPTLANDVPVATPKP